MTKNEYDDLERNLDNDIDNQAWTKLDKENDMVDIEDMHDDNNKQASQDDMARYDKTKYDNKQA